MTARDVFEKAMVLAGAVSPEGTVDRAREADLLKQGGVFLNQIYADLFYAEHPGETFSPVEMGEDLIRTLSPRAVYDVMPWGVAMLIAGAMGDPLTQSVMAAAYSQKREGTVKKARRVTDVLPTGEW